MKKNQDLFDLIHSLSRTEKRYFTLDARKAGKRESRYLRLFQAINQQEEYDEAELKKEFRRGLADDKARLYEAILRAMRDFRSHRSRAARIKELLLDADFLYGRGLYLQCRNRLSEARLIAGELEDQLAGLEINRESRRVLNTLLRLPGSGDLSELSAETDRYLGLLTEEFRYLEHVDALIREVHRLRQGATARREDELFAQYQEDLFTAKAPASLRGRIRFYQSRALYYQLLGRHAEVYENFSTVYRLWNENPIYKAEEFNRFLDDAFNLLTAMFQHRPAAHEALPLLNQLSAEQPADTNDQLILFQRTANLRLYHAINYDPQRPAREVLAPIREGLEQYDLNPVSELTIRYNAALLHFLQDNPDACEDWLTTIIDLRKNDLRPDIVQAARLLRIITLVDQEMGEDFLEAQMRSEQRYLQRVGSSRLGEFSRWLFRQLRKQLQLPFNEVPDFQRRAQTDLRSEWLGLPLGVGEVIDRWFTAKINNKKIMDE